MGIRFDIAAICLINTPLIILSMFQRVNEKFERICFICLNAIGFIATVDDYELFHFVGKRLSWDFFVITEDILEQLPQLTLYYWYLPTAAVLFTVGYYFFDKKFFISRNIYKKWPVHLMSGVLILGFTFVGIRGGLQHKSINVQSAFVQGKNELGHLVLNTPYHFLRTIKNQRVQPLAYFKQNEELDLILKNRVFNGDYKGEANFNVVIVILESFASEYVEQGYAPFLRELEAKSLSFERHLANGRRSIEALPAILCGLPALIDEPISKSAFGGNKFTCMPHLLKQHGYTNQFYHAGARGTMGFEAYTRASGFDRYFSREDYPEQEEDFDGTWGIFDEPYLKYVARELDKTKEPFLTGVFTLTSHQPYTLPSKFKGKFPKGKLEIHETIGYTDHALKEFFEAVKDRPWFKRTLFVITGDHSQKLETKKFQNLVGYYRVPLLLFAPGHKWKFKARPKVTQHADIPKSILDFVEVKSDGLPGTSNSIFTEDEGLALVYAEGATYFMAQGEKVLMMDKSGVQTATSFDWDSGAVGPEESSQDPMLKAYLQYFVNGLINNNLSLYR